MMRRYAPDITTSRHSSLLRLVIRPLAACALLTAITACTETPPITAPTPDDIEEFDAPLKQAIRHATALVNAAPDDPDNWITLGRLFHAHQIYDLAIPCYEHARGHGKNDARLFYLQALCEQKLGNTERAIQNIEHARALQDNASWVWWRSGLLLLDQGDVDEAETRFRKAIELDPADAGGSLGLALVLMQRGTPAEAVDVLRTMLERTDSERGYATFLLRRAQQLSNPDATQNETDGADRDVVPPRPAWSDPWIDDVRRRNVSAQSFYDRARAYIESEEPEKAIAILEPVMVHWRSRVSIAMELAVAYREAGRFSDAQALLAELLTNNPNSQHLHFNVARTLVSEIEATGHATRDKLESAERHAREGLRLAPNDSSLQGVMGDIHRLKGAAHAGLDAYLRAAALDPDQPLWSFRAAQILIDQSKFEEALPHARRVTSQRPDFAPGWHQLGVILTLLDQLGEAETALQEAINRDPDNPAYREALDALRQARSATNTPAGQRED